MKFLQIIVLSLFMTGIFPVKAQYNTGDDELNRTLVTIDANASLNFGAFRADISGRYNVTEGKIDFLAAEVGMNAGDIYMTMELAMITGKSIDQVIVEYNKYHGKGWGVIAKELGIKPGSPEFHALKGNAKRNGKNPGRGGKGKGKG
jgi:hypothetical protein